VARAVAVATVGELVLLAGASATGASLGTAVVAATWGAATWIAATSSATRQAELHYRARSRRVFLIATEQEVAAFADEAARQGGVSLVETELCLIDGTLADSTAGVAERVAAVRPSVVVVADRCVRHDDVAALAWQILVTGVHVRRLSDFYEMEFHKVALASVGRSWFLFDVAEIHRRRLYGSAKRLAESSIALALLVAAVPAVVAAALAIRLSSPGPILFTQARVGRGGGQFRLIKFRTMHCRAPGEDCDDEWARTDDPRIFRAGRVLRRFRIDELPQLWNVLRGDLSLIGPRPEQPQIAAGLAQTVPFYETRTCVRPGLTGWAQVNYGYGGSTLGSWAKLEYDLYYIKHQSLALDLKVLLATVTTVAAGGG
jgi:exopolysaccharide biosynthesis polyprenyl glycosylphosphotransferase